MNNLIIPKRNLLNFTLGFIITLVVLGGLSITIATTVFNANGGTITNLGTPTANSDAATKGYVDAAGGSGYINWSDCEYDTATSSSLSSATASCSTGYDMVEFSCYQDSGTCEITGVNEITVTGSFSGVASTDIKCCKYIS